LSARAVNESASTRIGLASSEAATPAISSEPDFPDKAFEERRFPQRALLVGIFFVLIWPRTGAQIRFGIAG
jgi:hypothetical protein